MRNLLFTAMFLSGTASADELVINYGDTDTLYEGRLQFVDSDGMAGYTHFVTDVYPASVGQWAGDVPLLTGLWHVSIRDPRAKGHTVEGLGNCYATIGYMADHGARIVLTCASWSVER